MMNLNCEEYIIEPEDVYKNLPHKKKNIHKYSAGKVFTIAGSGKLPGAAVLTSKSVLKAGAGASILAFPKSVRKLVHKNLTEVIVETYEDNGTEIFLLIYISSLKKRIEWTDVLTIGPGLGRDEETSEGIFKLIKSAKSKFL